MGPRGAQDPGLCHGWSQKIERGGWAQRSGEERDKELVRVPGPCQALRCGPSFPLVVLFPVPPSPLTPAPQKTTNLRCPALIFVLWPCEMLVLVGTGWRASGISWYHFCNFSVNLKLVQHKAIMIKHTTATAKSLLSCLTLCDPIDSSPPGSAVPGILQARTLEWVAISFSNA
ncbi:unnamed protein product [Rangifer tarandus platyrhynchus]|uniref:Uncharacterized protein n=1 Tax=Rangifer tarandus platyrhynchus TaxID=3082113 RepID=A0ABN8Z8I7_RANTA|nr:unnamed protein product [Rangifer tarandus platyrhynchus]